MNKNAIQRFAVWARTELISQISQKAYQYGVTKEGCGDPDADSIDGRMLTADEKRQRRQLIERISHEGFDSVMEEVAYTWFNRFIALRFMEVNNYLPSHTRVFSDSTGAFRPEILANAMHIELPGLDPDKVSSLIEKNKNDALYAYLLLTQCNALNASLPRMFEPLGSYTELLLPNNILRADSVPGRMVTDIPEEDWTDQVQIIGWLYQYYNSELKDDVFALLKKNVKITKERIPAATQLFTPDWIVRYMVENSLGRLFIEKQSAQTGQSEESLAREMGWRYYIPSAEGQAPDGGRRESFSLTDVKLIDPCMGSGHILVYAFDLLVQIYQKAGYSERDAAGSILENNIYGLDVDERAAQLAYFAVMMKARQYDRRILTRGIQPRLYGPGPDPDVREYGSLLQPKQSPETKESAQLSMLDESDSFKRLLTQKYDVVVTNPPYAGAGGLNPKLVDFLKENYPDTKYDLFAAFIEKCMRMAKPDCMTAMITQQAWMFLSSFEKLRVNIISDSTIINMAHLGNGAFGVADFGLTAFVLKNRVMPGYRGTYFRLTEQNNPEWKEQSFLSGENSYTADQANFSKIPGAPVAYWVSEKFIEAFKNGKPLGEVAAPRQGLATADNDRFLRMWHEVEMNRIHFHATSCSDAAVSGYKWFPYNKGGDFRKWYGNNDFIINWENDGLELRANKKAVIRNPTYYFKPCVSWSKISSGTIAFRFKPVGHIFDVAGTSIFSSDNISNYIEGFCNSKVTLAIVNAISPTLNYEVGHIASLPIIFDDGKKEKINNLVAENINISKHDWDYFETSWDFKKNPLV